MDITIATHNGPFHADDVFACVMAGALRTGRKVVRTRDEDLIAEANIVLDVGGEYDHSRRRYDHHQPSFGETHPATGEEEPTPMATAGLMWHYSSYLFNEFNLMPQEERYVNEYVRKELVEGIDAADNGVEKNDLSAAISRKNPQWDEDASFDEKFVEAMHFAKEVLDDTIKSGMAEYRAKTKFQDSPRIEDGKIAVLDRYLPWSGMPVEDGLLYVVYPASGGGWRVQQVPTTPGGMKGRKPLPAPWVENTPDVDGGDVIFVHGGRFIAGTTTREAALDMARQAVAV